MTNINIELLKKTEEKEWDEFVVNHPLGRFSQTTAFKRVLEETYGYRSNFIVLKRGEKIIGIFPLFWWRDIFGKTHLVSVPFADYGGPLNEEISGEEAKSFIEFLKNILSEYGASFLKVNSGLELALQKNLERHFLKKGNNQRAVLKLEKPDILWEKFDRSVRKCVNAAQREKLNCLMETSPAAISHDFYPLYLSSMKRLGTPPHPPSYFLNKLKYFSGDMKLFLVRFGSKTIAVLLGFAIGNTVQITKTASDPRYWLKRPNDLAHWEFIKWSSENNYQYFDFGPVRYENQLRYKMKWGAQISENYNYYLTDASDGKVFLKDSSESSLLFKCFSKIWSCLPGCLSQKIGPFIRKNMGR